MNYARFEEVAALAGIFLAAGSLFWVFALWIVKPSLALEFYHLGAGILLEGYLITILAFLIRHKCGGLNDT